LKYIISIVVIYTVLQYVPSNFVPIHTKEIKMLLFRKYQDQRDPMRYVLPIKDNGHSVITKTFYLIKNNLVFFGFGRVPAYLFAERDPNYFQKNNGFVLSSK
jgi:hypothetical protein